jgi:hypothetical protein
MILHVVSALNYISEARSSREMYHRLVNTTPNPRATKNSNGEFVGPEPVCGAPLSVGDGVDDVVDVLVMVEDVVVAIATRVQPYWIESRQSRIDDQGAREARSCQGGGD